jgi:hypothetical protein
MISGRIVSVSLLPIFSPLEARTIEDIMNRPPETYVLVQEERLLAFAIACFEKAGLDHHHASTISRLLVNSDLRGVRSHGTRTVNHYCKRLEDGVHNTKPNIRKVAIYRW